MKNTQPMPSSGRALLALIGRDLRLALRHRSEAVTPIIFLTMVTVLFPLGLGSDAKQLAAIAPGVVWVAALLASMLSLHHLFDTDFNDGTLEQLVMSPYSLPLLVSAKVVVHWLSNGLPLVLITPLLALGYHLETQALGVLFITLLLGTPTLGFIGAIGVALTVALRRGGMFLALLVLPLTIPVLIFATAAVAAAVDGLPTQSHLLLLGALLVLAVTLAPFAIAAALRISLT